MLRVKFGGFPKLSDTLRKILACQVGEGQLIVRFGRIRRLPDFVLELQNCARVVLRLHELAATPEKFASLRLLALSAAARTQQERYEGAHSINLSHHSVRILDGLVRAS